MAIWIFHLDLRKYQYLLKLLKNKYGRIFLFIGIIQDNYNKKNAIKMTSL